MNCHTGVPYGGPGRGVRVNGDVGGAGHGGHGGGDSDLSSGKPYGLTNTDVYLGGSTGIVESSDVDFITKVDSPLCPGNSVYMIYLAIPDKDNLIATIPRFHSIGAFTKQITWLNGDLDKVKLMKKRSQDEDFPSFPTGVEPMAFQIPVRHPNHFALGDSR